MVGTYAFGFCHKNRRTENVPDHDRRDPRPLRQVLRGRRPRVGPGGRAGRCPAGCVPRHAGHGGVGGDHPPAPDPGRRGGRPRPPRRPQPAQPAGDGDRERREPRAGARRGQRPDQQPPGQPGLLEPHPGRRVRHRGNHPRGGQRPGRPDRGHEGVRPRLRRAGHRRGDARRRPERADGGAAQPARAPAREGSRHAAPVRRQPPPDQRGRQVQAVPGVRDGGERRQGGPRRPQTQGGGLRGERQGGAGHRGRGDRARVGRRDGQHRGEAPARPHDPDAEAGGPPGLPRYRRPQGQRPHRGQARGRAGVPRGGQGRAGQDQPAGAPAPGLRVLAGHGHHLQHDVPAPREREGVERDGAAGAPRPLRRVRSSSPEGVKLSQRREKEFVCSPKQEHSTGGG